MAKAISVWGIDLGQCALKAVRLTYDAKADQVIATAFDYIEHAKILSQPDAEPEELINAALEKFLSRNDTEGDVLSISLPGHAGLAKFVTLPPVESKKIPDIVKFEARQQIPFPLEDVVWDYQKVGGGIEEEGFALETEVGIFAVKRDTVYRHLNPFVKMGLEIETIQLAPLCLYNFAAYDYFWAAQAKKKKAKEDKKKKKGDEAEAEAEAAEGEGEPEGGDTVVILDIGAEKTDVVITDGDTIWLRNLPIGGNHFTRALTKDLKLTFAKGEHLKRNATKAPDPKKLYQAMRPVFQDFVNELQKSLGFFSSTHRDREIKRILGVGSGFKLPGLQKFLQQNLQFEIEKVNQFNGLEGDEVLSAAAFTENLASFCVAYGLALQGLGQTPLQTNLLPNEIQYARIIRAKKPWSLTAAAVLLLAFSGVFWGNWRIYNEVHAKTWDGPTQTAQAATSKFQQWKSEFDGAVSKFDGTKVEGESLFGVKNAEARLDWMKVIQAINSCVPQRGSPETDKELGTIPEFNLEYIDAAYLPLGDWFNNIPEENRKHMTMADQEKAPEGEGWVFQVMGYTFHKEGRVYVNEIVKRFQDMEKDPTMRKLLKQGISHAVLVSDVQVDDWQPSKGSTLKGWKKMFERAGKGGAPPPSQEPDNASMGPMNEIPSYVPDDVRDYMKESEKRAKEQPAMQIPRTDFAIQFVWIPPRPENAPAGETPPPAP